MNVYETSSIRNVVFLGHGGSGKTTFAEAISYSTGVITRMGRVQDGNTISDYDKEEIKRKFSINASVIPVEWNGLKINILDAPGYFDFVGQMEDAMSVADAAVIVVNGRFVREDRFQEYSLLPTWMILMLNIWKSWSS